MPDPTITERFVDKLLAIRFDSIPEAAIETARGAARNGLALVEELVDGPEVTVVGFSIAGRFTALAVTGDATSVLASGGLKDGVDVAVCLALGAVAGGLARQFLLAAQTDRASQAAQVFVRQLRIATWLAGASSSSDLTPTMLRPAGAIG